MVRSIIIFIVAILFLSSSIYAHSEIFDSRITFECKTKITSLFFRKIKVEDRKNVFSVSMGSFREWDPYRNTWGPNLCVPIDEKFHDHDIYRKCIFEKNLITVAKNSSGKNAEGIYESSFIDDIIIDRVTGNLRKFSSAKWVNDDGTDGSTFSEGHCEERQ